MEGGFGGFAASLGFQELGFSHPPQTSPVCCEQSQWQPQLQQLRDMGIHDDELSLRALQATGGDIQAALELIFAGGAP